MRARLVCSKGCLLEHFGDHLDEVVVISVFRFLHPYIFLDVGIMGAVPFLPALFTAAHLPNIQKLDAFFQCPKILLKGRGTNGSGHFRVPKGLHLFRHILAEFILDAGDGHGDDAAPFHEGLSPIHIRRRPPSGS